MRNQFLAKELITIMKDFKTQGISALPFKGPALAAMAYGDLSLREFVDLDILVHQAQLSHAFDVFIEKGFFLKGIDRAKEQTYSPHNKTYTFTRGKGLAQIRVDLQSLIVGENFAVHIDDKTVWNRVTEISLVGELVPSLAAEDLLLTLCIHGSKHLWEKTKWICDVAELIQRHKETINWSLVNEQANQLGSRKMLELGLYMAQYLEQIGDSKEGFTRDAFKRYQATDTAISALALRIGGRLFNKVEKEQKIHEAATYYLIFRDSFSERFRYYVHLCLIPLPTKYWGLLPCPRLFALFYSFVVSIRFLVKYGLRSQHLKVSISKFLNAHN
jgi:hypothetical protein